jgi:hypothetical protein
MGYKPFVAVVVTTAIAAGGCGSSGSSHPLSRAELRKQANAICTHREAQLQTVIARSKSPAGAQRAALPTLDKALADLDALEPPAAVKAKYARFVSDERTHIAEIRSGLSGKPTDHRTAAALGHERLRLMRGLGITCPN